MANSANSTHPPRNLKFFYDSAQHPDPAVLHLLEHHRIQTVDFSPHLKHSSERYLNEFMELCTQGAGPNECYIIPPLSLNRLVGKPPMSQVTLLSQTSVPGGMSIYDQVCAIIGHTSIRDGSFGDIFSSSGIAGLCAAGASQEQSRRLALTHRLANGGTMRDEAIAASLFENFLPQRSDESHLVYEFNSSRLWDTREMYVRRSLLDHLLLEKADRELALIVSTRNSDDEVTSMLAIATNRDDINAATTAAHDAGYGISTYCENRNQLHVLHLYSRNITFPVKGFTQFFTGAAVPATV